LPAFPLVRFTSGERKEGSTMTIRSAAHKKAERGFFDAFLRAYPSFAVGVVDASQPDEEFPDIVVMLKDGTAIDFELGEWLDETQMAEAMRLERLEKAVLRVIGQQGRNTSVHFNCVMLSPRDDAPAFRTRDAGPFRSSFFALLAETEKRWPNERFWRRGHLCREFEGYEPLGTYIESVRFEPLNVRGTDRPWPDGQPFINFRAHGSFYSPETAIAALERVVSDKLSRYGPLPRPTRLIIHYGRALMHNTPYYGPHTRSFADVARKAAEIFGGQSTFEIVYLFEAVTPGAQVFEISPRFAKRT